MALLRPLEQTFFDDGQASSLADAVHWLGAGCRLREERSCARLFDIGQLYSSGKLSAKDDSRAAKLFDESCEGGYFPACHSLGVATEQGLGCEKNLPKAVALYRKSCEGEFMPACSNLGTLYDEGASRKTSLGRANYSPNYARRAKIEGARRCRSTSVNARRACFNGPRAAVIHRRRAGGWRVSLQAPPVRALAYSRGPKPGV